VQHCVIYAIQEHGAHNVAPCICMDYWCDQSFRQINIYSLLLVYS